MDTILDEVLAALIEGRTLVFFQHAPSFDAAADCSFTLSLVENGRFNVGRIRFPAAGPASESSAMYSETELRAFLATVEPELLIEALSRGRPAGSRRGLH